MIAMLALAAMITAFLIAIGLNRSRTEVSNEQEDRNMSALRQAKAALIAYAANEQWQLYKALPAVPPTAYFQPGALPCPDKDDDGDADCVGLGITPTSSIIGRLPWKTIGVDDLRDSSGERLWYALSWNFRKLQGGSPPTIINSDTQGQLSVTGTAPMNNVVAVLIAPGLPILNQTRSPNPANPAHNSASNYLEGFDLSNPVNYVFTSNARPSDTFNDRLLVITQADLMAAVEPVVAARIERDVVPVLQSYYSGWQVYPFPAPFNPGLAQSAYQGDKNQTRGLLPITPGPNWLQWDPASVSVTQIAGGTGSGLGPFPPNPLTISPYPPDCSASTTTQISCDIRYSGGGSDRPKIQLQATLRKATLAFARPYTIWDAVMTDINGDPMAAGIYAQFSDASLIPPTVSATVLANREDATVVFQGVLLNPGPPAVGGSGGKALITIGFTYAFNDPSPPSPKPDVDWFIKNEWFRQTYYAVSQGFLAGGGNACNAPAVFACLTVNNLRPSYTISNDKQAIVLLAGRSLNGITRPSTNLPDYFENVNLTAANGTTLVYENRPGSPTAINDRVVVVSP
jgi:hypothetical protein